MDGEEAAAELKGNSVEDLSEGRGRVMRVRSDSTPDTASEASTRRAPRSTAGCAAQTVKNGGLTDLLRRQA